MVQLTRPPLIECQAALVLDARGLAKLPYLKLLAPNLFQAHLLATILKYCLRLLHKVSPSLSLSISPLSNRHIWRGIQLLLLDPIIAPLSMDLSNIFRLVNLAVGGLMILGGIGQFFPIGFQSAIVGCYVIIFGAATLLLEFQIPPYMSRWAPFLFSFLGRGIFYIFVGTILLQTKYIRIIPGSMVAIVGVGYCVLEYIPSIEPPQNMRDASGEWGAEQV
ncbi:COPI associated protein-domain-containing protein [Usnea florida]